MEHSAGLRQDTDQLKKKLAELEERHTAKVQALARELIVWIQDVSQQPPLLLLSEMLDVPFVTLHSVASALWPPQTADDYFVWENEVL
ncbi:hypothetical protein INR49_003857, partial [Caranx melampygus]